MRLSRALFTAASVQVSQLWLSGLSCPSGVGLELVLFPNTPKSSPDEMVCACGIVRVPWCSILPWS